MFNEPEGYLSREPFAKDHVPGNYARSVAIDMDQKQVGIVWGARDRTNDVTHIYGAMVRPRFDLASISALLRDRGVWIPVLFDYERVGKAHDEGFALAKRLGALGANVLFAPAELEATLEVLGQKLSTGRIKVVETQADWFAAYRRCARDDKGAFNRSDALLISATALLLSHPESAMTENQAASDAKGHDVGGSDRSSTTGY